jgi:hypothetical protein
VSVLLAGALSASLLAPAPGTAGSARSAVIKFFRTPSGLVGCVYSTGPTFLRCDTAYHTRFYNRRHCVEGVYGLGFGMTRSGAAHPLCTSDSARDPRAAVLAYGATRRYGPYACTSRPDGLRCRNQRGHGWLLSRRQQRVF